MSTWQWEYMVLLLKGGWRLEPHDALRAAESIAGQAGTVRPGRVFLLLSKRLEREGANT